MKHNPYILLMPILIILMLVTAGCGDGGQSARALQLQQQLEAERQARAQAEAMHRKAEERAKKQESSRGTWQTIAWIGGVAAVVLLFVGAMLGSEAVTEAETQKRNARRETDE